MRKCSNLRNFLNVSERQTRLHEHQHVQHPAADDGGGAAEEGGQHQADIRLHCRRGYQG